MADYLAKLRSPALLEHPSMQGRGIAVMPTEREPHVARAFAISFDRLNPDDPIDTQAIALLVRAAYLAPGAPFPRALLTAAVAVTDEEGKLLVEDGVERLLGLGLLEEEGPGSLRIHRLLALYAARAIDDPNAAGAIEQIVSREAARLNEMRYPGAMLPLLAHLRSLVQTSEGRADLGAALLSAHLGHHLYLAGDYVAARPLYERALQIHEQVQGINHPNTAASLNNLAALLKAQGQYDAARPLYERALQITKRMLGADHPFTAASFNNLAQLYYAQGGYDAARPLYERALQITERTLGADHPLIAQGLNNLAQLHYAQGAYDAARPLYERALQIHEQVLGADHPDTATTLNNLAQLYYVEGQYDVARPLYERALQITERTLGADHPDTASSLNNLAVLLKAQGQYDAARLLYERALQIYERTLGADHPLTATSLNNLAILHAKQGNFITALPLMEQAHTLRLRILGPRHPDIYRSQQSLQAMRRDAAMLTITTPIRAALEQRDDAAVQTALEALVPDEAKATMEQLRQAGIISTSYGLDTASLEAIAAVARGDDRQRAEVETALAELETQEWYLAESVRRIWAGERDLDTLTTELDAEDTEVITRVLELLNAPPTDAADDATQRRAVLAQRAEAATETALREGSAEERAALTERLITTAEPYAHGDDADQALAAHLHALAEQLRR